MSDQTVNVARVNVYDERNFEPLPEYNGKQAVLFEEGPLKVGSFKEHGTFNHVADFDEIFFVVAGTSKVTVGDDEPFTMRPGDLVYLRKGQDVTFEHDEYFHDVAVLVNDIPGS